MINLITLLFAPSFLILTDYFDFNKLVLAYIIVTIIFMILSIIKKRKAEDYIVISIYLVLLMVAYFSTSLNVVKYIPIFTSMVFVSIFIHATINKTEIIFRFTKKFYTKQLSDKEVLYLKNGDLYWAIALFIYMLALFSVVLMGNDMLWAILSSVGWYIYFIIILTIQILYGKLYATKMYTK